MLNSIPHTLLADLVASLTKASFAEKLEILDAIDLMDRFKKALPLLVRQVKGMYLIAYLRSKFYKWCCSNVFYHFQCLK